MRIIFISRKQLLVFYGCSVIRTKDSELRNFRDAWRNAEVFLQQVIRFLDPDFSYAIFRFLMFPYRELTV
jgi:hypothetical protein